MAFILYDSNQMILFLTSEMTNQSFLAKMPLLLEGNLNWNSTSYFTVDTLIGTISVVNRDFAPKTIHL